MALVSQKTGTFRFRDTIVLVNTFAKPTATSRAVGTATPGLSEFQHRDEASFAKNANVSISHLDGDLERSGGFHCCVRQHAREDAPTNHLNVLGIDDISVKAAISSGTFSFAKM